MKKRYNNIKTGNFLTCIVCLAMISIAGCKKAIDIGKPTTLINTANIYTSDGTAESAVAGIFSSLALPSHMYNGGASISIQQGLEADEFTYYGTNPGPQLTLYTNSVTQQPAVGNPANYYWPEIYAELYDCNAAIAGLTSTSSGSLTPTVHSPLLGEVKFLRAFIYFNAINLYGDVPLVLTTDPNVNQSVARTPAATVLQQVVKDLTDAQSLLPDNSYLTLAGLASTNRILPNKQTASALLARVYLYLKDWKNAEAQASNVISASNYLLEPVLNNVFLKASRETIWQLQSVSTTYGNADALLLQMKGIPNTTTNQYALSNSLVSAFESGDNRFTSWVGQVISGTTTYYYANKYKQGIVSSSSIVTEYPVMFRLAEQFLIRAEARAQQSNISGAQSDLNAVRTRAGLSNATAATPADLLNSIYREQRIELFTELGHRWFDLKRTGQLDAVMAVAAPLKGGVWNAYEVLFPIPVSEITADSHLTQNLGYH